VGPTYNKVGGATGYGTSTQAPSSNVGEVQGGYAGADHKVLEKDGHFHMPGKNVHEDPNLSGKSEFGEVGTNKDPGRQAELDFAKRMAAGGGVGSKGGATDDGSKFSGLSDEAA
jgi:hypothetical protein